MGWKIKSNTLFIQRYLKIDAFGVTFCETAFTGGKRTFRFEEIDGVCMSPENLLSLHVGNEVFSLSVNPEKKQHQEAVSALLSGLGRTLPAPAR
jgi:hypothetical protein